MKNAKFRRLSLTKASIALLGLAIPFAAQSGTLFVEGDNVGVRASSPEHELDVKSREAGSPVFQIKSSDGQKLLLFSEVGNTAATMKMYDPNGNPKFQLSATGDNYFASAGEVGIGCQTPDFDLTIGSVVANCSAGSYSKINAGSATFTTSSSRSLKKNLQDVEPGNILDKVANIDVYEYDFIEGPAGRLGLMAEDFHEVFGRGSDKEIDGQDVMMALWLSVQELTSQNKALAEKIALQEQQLEQLAGGSVGTDAR